MIKFVFRWAFRLVLLAVVLAIGLLLLKDKIARNLVEERIRKDTGFEAKLGKLEFSLFSPRVTVEVMAQRTLAHYERAIAGRLPAPPLRPLEKGRVLYALGYRPWHAPTGAWRSKRTSFIARVRRAASRRQAKLADRLAMRLHRR